MQKNILHIVSGNLDGGAARGAYWLHQGLIDLGSNSKVLGNFSDPIMDPTVVSVGKSYRNQKIKNGFNLMLDQFPVKLYKKRQNTFFSTALFGYDISDHPLYHWADIIHLHWINGGFLNVKYLKNIKKPIVWTLRDMWPFTGGCHYSLDCNKFVSGCGACPQLGSSRDFDLSRYLLKRKEEHYTSNIHVVGISDWISDQARKSRIFKDFPVQTIVNNVNCDDFFPIDKEVARKLLGISSDKKIILAGAQSIKDYYKGFGKYTDALQQLNKESYYLTFFGNLSNEIAKDFGFEYKNFGFLKDTIALRLLYSAADVFVAPSIMDAFGKTLVEAMACGTPVVCFDATGPKEIVDHKVNGYKAVPFDSGDLSRGIEWIANHDDFDAVAFEARKKAVDFYDSEVVAEQYLKLYDSL